MFRKTLGNIKSNAGSAVKFIVIKPLVKTQSFWQKAVFMLFALLYAFTANKCLFDNKSGLSATLLFALLVGVCAFMWCAYNTLGGISKKWHKRILIGFIAITSVIQLYVGFQLRFTPNWDIAAIFDGGRDWAVNGHFQNWWDYFGTQTANLGALFLFRCIFGIYNFFGGTDFFAAALVYNTIMLEITVLAVYDSARRLAGRRAGLMTLVLWGAYLPFYTMGASFYTDGLSMPFMALVVNLYLRARNERIFKQKMIYFIWCGIFTAIGAIIKATVLIPFIAIALNWVLYNRCWTWSKIGKRLAGFGSVCAVVILIVVTFYSFIFNKIDPQISHERRLPLTHWMWMGLNRDSKGAYSSSDFDYSMNSLENYDVRNRELPKRFRERLNEFGFREMIEHLGNKFAVSYQSGTFDQSGLFWLNPPQETEMHDIVLPDREHFGAYNHVATASMLALIVFSILGAIIFFVDRSSFCFPWLSLAGSALFLCIWESMQRYPHNLMPAFVLCATLTLAALYGDKPVPRPKPRYKRRDTLALTCVGYSDHEYAHSESIEDNY
ncbi:MAG: glycosyltransferase family 39 protein [Oscillospiraceae bacterium]|nr:glycosyltransferase family 39 protein [Oscillospiraceae bacterium]